MDQNYRQKSFLFLVNPIAGNGKALETIKIIEETMERLSLNYKTILLKKPGQATELAFEQAKKFDLIVAVGGDGTINEVAKGILNSGSGKLGIVPSGTGNDLVRTLGIPVDVKKSLNILLEGKSNKIDVGYVNDHLFLNIASIGYDAEVIVNHHKFKGRVPRRLVYIFSLLYTFLKYKEEELKLCVGDEIISEETLLLAVGKGQYYGGGFRILPFGQIQSGRLNICLVRKLSKFRLPFLLSKLLGGKHINELNHVSIYESDRITVYAKRRVSLNVDGEIPSKEKTFEFRVEKQVLNVVY